MYRELSTSGAFGDETGSGPPELDDAVEGFVAGRDLPDGPSGRMEWRFSGFRGMTFTPRRRVHGGGRLAHMFCKRKG